MPYLIAQILFCLLVAVALGAMVGWLAKDLLSRRTLHRAEDRWRRRLRQAEVRAGTLKNQLVEAQQITEDLRSELRMARQSPSGAAPETTPDSDGAVLEALRAELTQRDKKIDLLKLQVSRSEAALTSEWESLKALKTELAERQQRLDNRDRQRQTSWSNRLKESEDLRQKQGRQLAQLKQRFDSQEEELATLRRELDDERRPAQTHVQSTTAPAGEDDLTRIRGIGPVLQRKLHQLGVTAFRQIAAWTEEDIDRVGSELGAFSGRIRRDRWTESAAKLQRDS